MSGLLTHWTRARLLPLLALGALVGALLGWLRARYGFVAGLQGMAAGVALGYASGRLGRDDPERFWSLPQRAWLALDAAFVVTAVQLLVVGAFRSPAGEGPLAWLSGVLDGSQREAFASLGGARYFHRTVSGSLFGGWWVALNALDLALMAFLSLAGQMLALPPGERPHAGERTAARAFPVLLVLLPAVFLGWDSVIARARRRAGREAAAAVLGSWELSGWDGLAPSRRFELFDPRDGAHDLAGVSEEKPLWTLLLARTNEGYEGTLALPSGARVPVSLRAADGSLELRAEGRLGVARRR